MFRPVSGEHLHNYDPETIQLYRRRQSDPVESMILASGPRPQRHFIPVPLDPEGEVA